MKYLSTEFKLMRFLAKANGWKGYVHGETIQNCKNPDGTLDMAKVKALFLERKHAKDEAEFDDAVVALKGANLIENAIKLKAETASSDKLTAMEAARDERIKTLGLEERMEKCDSITKADIDLINNFEHI